MYQRFAKRYDPEIISFIEHALFMMIPEVDKLDTLEIIINFSYSSNSREYHRAIFHE